MIAEPLFGRPDVQAKARWPRRAETIYRSGGRVQRAVHLTSDLADQIPLGEHLARRDVEKAGRALLQQVKRSASECANVDARGECVVEHGYLIARLDRANRPFRKR